MSRFKLDFYIKSDRSWQQHWILASLDLCFAERKLKLRDIKATRSAGGCSRLHTIHAFRLVLVLRSHIRLSLFVSFSAMQLLWSSHVWGGGETGSRVDRIPPNSDICQFPDSACVLWVGQLIMTPEPLLLVGIEHRKPNHLGCLRQKVTSYRKWEGVKHERQGPPSQSRVLLTVVTASGADYFGYLWVPCTWLLTLTWVYEPYHEFFIEHIPMTFQ